jgi:hypothetical protein
MLTNKLPSFRRILAGLFSTLLLSCAADAQSDQLDREAIVQAKKFVDTVYTQCRERSPGDNVEKLYYYRVSTPIGDSLAEAVTGLVYARSTLLLEELEIHDANLAFVVEREELLNGDRLNQIGWKGRIKIKADAVRFNDSEELVWSDWKDLDLDPTLEPTKPWAMQYKNGRWDVPLPRSLAPKITCEAAKNRNPFHPVPPPPPAPTTNVSEKEIREAADGREITSVSRPKQIGTPAPEKPAPYEMTVTADEFASRFAEAVKKRSADVFGSSDTSQYESAITTIIGLVHTCVTISASDFLSAFKAPYGPHLWELNGGKYGNCSLSVIPVDQVRASAKPSQKASPGPGLVIRDTLQRHWNAGMWDGPKFHIDVYLKPQQATDLAGTASDRLKYIVVSADVKE